MAGLKVQVSSIDILAQARFGTSPVSNPTPLSAQRRRELQLQVLQHHAAQEQQFLRSDTTWRNWRNAHDQFSRFSAVYMGAAQECWHAAQPVDILVYFYRQLLPSHTGRDQDDAATSTVRGKLSNLSMCFELHGRSGTWDPSTGHGNPVLSRDVQHALQAYGRRLLHQGVRERSAVPLAWDKLQMLISLLDLDVRAAVRRSGPVTVSTFCDVRDGALLLYMWHSLRRCKDALYINWEDIYFKCGFHFINIQPYWSVVSAPPAGQLVLVPSASKTEHDGRPKTQLLASDDPTAVTCGVRWLYMLYHCQRRHADKQTLQGPVFCSSRDGTRLRTAAALNRIKALLARYRCDGGETVHSLRRGSIQDARASGASDASVKARSGITTDDILARYMDLGRHLP